jgi:hypothetical protein
MSKDDKKDISPFLLADEVAKLLTGSGASKKLIKEALGLVAAQHGLRLVPVGVPLERRVTAVAPAANAAASVAQKGGAKKTGKTGINADPAVVAAQHELDARLQEIRDLKSRNESIPPQVVTRKDEALKALQLAKANARSTSQAKTPEENKQA